MNLKVVASAGIAVLIVSGVVYLAIVSSVSYTNEIECTDSGFIQVEAEAITVISAPGTRTTTSQSMLTVETVVASYSTTTNKTATVGLITSSTITTPGPILGYNNVLSESVIHSCTYIRSASANTP
jgi:hypothetical protein